MTDREWADRLHSELGDLMYVLRLYNFEEIIRANQSVDDSWVNAFRAFRDYKQDVQKLDYETGRPL